MENREDSLNKTIKETNKHKIRTISDKTAEEALLT
jgi:hypothetical protein